VGYVTFNDRLTENEKLLESESKNETTIEEAESNI
jgi:hypothetical protein